MADIPQTEENLSQTETESSKSSTVKGSFASDVLKIGVGATFAQGLLVLIAPVLSRLYAPEAFGLAALFISISNVIAVIACLRYDLSIMLPEKDEEAANLLAASIALGVIVSALTFLVFFLSRAGIAQLLNFPDIFPYLLLVPLSVFLFGAVRALNYWNSRTKQYSRVSVARVFNSISTAGIQLGGGFSGYTRGGSLILAFILGWGASAVFLGLCIWRENSQLFLSSVRWRKMWAGLVRYRKFPLVSSWSGLFNSISLQTPVLLLAVFFSPVQVGFYALGHRVLRMPMDLVGAAIAQVFYQRASEAHHQGNLAAVVDNVFRQLILIGMFPLLLLTIIGEELFVVVFGANWAEAGIYMQILAIWTFFAFISNPISTLVNTLEKQEIALIFNVILVVSRVTSLIIGGIAGNVYLALGLFSASGVLSWMWFSLWLVNKAGVPFFRIFSTFAYFLVLCAPFLASIAFSKYYLQLGSLELLGLSGIAALIFYAIVLMRDRKLLMALLSPLQRYCLKIKFQ